MRIVLDTGVLWRPEALRRLAGLAEDVVVPAVVFLERARQVVKNRRDAADLRAWIERNQFQIKSFGEDEAMRYGVRVSDDREWKRLARDAMIAGHVRKDDVLWTTNAKDFVALGLPKEQILELR